jgi:hypothetical protein
MEDVGGLLFQMNVSSSVDDFAFKPIFFLRSGTESSSTKVSL